jgi:hypothetical protein
MRLKAGESSTTRWIAISVSTDNYRRVPPKLRRSVLGTTCNVEMFLVGGITFNIAISLFHPLGSSETSSQPRTQYCRTS